MKKQILTILIVGALICALSLGAAAATPQKLVQPQQINISQAAKIIQAAPPKEVVELTRCKKTIETPASGIYPATSAESYLLRDKNCEGQLNFKIDSSKEELGFSFKTKAYTGLTQLISCDRKPENGAATVVIITSDSATPSCASYGNNLASPNNLGYIFKKKEDADALQLSVKPLYVCPVTGGLVKPREVPCGGLGSTGALGFVLTEKPATPTSGYGNLYRCKKTTGTPASGIYPATTADHYLARADCQGYLGYNTDSSQGELAYTFTSKINTKLVPLVACEKPEGGGIVSFATAFNKCGSNLNAKNLGYAFKEKKDAPAAFKVKALYACPVSGTGEVKPSATTCGGLLGSTNAVAWLPENNNQPLPTYECGDGLDNDNDGKTDMQDSGCSSPEDDEASASECSDGLDNDNDGLTDLADLDCKTPKESKSCPTCTTETAQPSSCVDNAWTSNLPVTQQEAEAWQPLTDEAMAGLNINQMQERIVDSEAILQYIVCKNKCLRTEDFKNKNCKPVSNTTGGWNVLQLKQGEETTMMQGVTIQLMSVSFNAQEARVLMFGQARTLVKGQGTEITNPTQPKILVVLTKASNPVIGDSTAEITWKVTGAPAVGAGAAVANTFTGRVVAFFRGL